ncbi:PLP-dependent transferase [Microthyrium microscopicum]|uniref:PLP-dependent transferase n=1 Tax=Microthyrium microscopicum TaxID=703497 RepID=A0A6A6UK42_9PEZI|nr:PLP-dependent transferase [Microthyrium microscopicum]
MSIPQVVLPQDWEGESLGLDHNSYLDYSSSPRDKKSIYMHAMSPSSPQSPREVSWGMDDEMAPSNGSSLEYTLPQPQQKQSDQRYTAYRPPTNSGPYAPSPTELNFQQPNIYGGFNGPYNASSTDQEIRPPSNHAYQPSANTLPYAPSSPTDLSTHQQYHSSTSTTPYAPSSNTDLSVHQQYHSSASTASYAPSFNNELSVQQPYQVSSNNLPYGATSDHNGSRVVSAVSNYDFPLGASSMEQNNSRASAVSTISANPPQLGIQDFKSPYSFQSSSTPKFTASVGDLSVKPEIGISPSAAPWTATASSTDLSANHVHRIPKGLISRNGSIRDTRPKTKRQIASGFMTPKNGSQTDLGFKFNARIHSGAASGFHSRRGSQEDLSFKPKSRIMSVFGSRNGSWENLHAPKNPRIASGLASRNGSTGDLRHKSRVASGFASKNGSMTDLSAFKKKSRIASGFASRNGSVANFSIGTTSDRMSMGIMTPNRGSAPASARHSPKHSHSARSSSPDPIPYDEGEVDLKPPQRPSAYDRIREMARLQSIKARVSNKEKRELYKPTSKKGEFALAHVEPLFTWWGKNERVLQTQSLGRVRVKNSDGPASTVLNASSYNYAGLYKTIPKAEELQQLVMDKLPFSAAQGVEVMENATNAVIGRFFGANFCYTMSSGYGANFAALAALADTSTMFLVDEKCHSSMFAGIARGQAGAVHTFKHNDMEDLERILKSASAKWGHTVVAIEGMYSFHGTLPPLDDLHRLKKEFHYTLFCNESHSFLSLGQSGRGCLERWNYEPTEIPVPWDLIDIRTASLANSLGAAGGLICGKTEYGERIRAHLQKLRIQGEEPLSLPAMVQTLWVLGQPTRTYKKLHRLSEISRYFRRELTRFGIFTYGETGSPIMPIHCGRPTVAAKLSYVLRQWGVIATPVTSPAVEFWESRVVVYLTADFSDREIDELLKIIIRSTRRLGLAKKSNLTVNLTLRAFKYRSPSDLGDDEGEEAVMTYQHIEDLIQQNVASSKHQLNHYAVIEAGQASRKIYGLASGSSRGMAGTFPPHLATEALLAKCLGMQSAMTFADASIGVSSTVAALCRPFLNYENHCMLIGKSLPYALHDGLNLADKSVIRYRDNTHLVQIIQELQSHKKTYITVFMDLPDQESHRQFAHDSKKIMTKAPMTIFLHSPSIIPVASNYSHLNKLPHTEVLAYGSFYHTFGLSGGYLTGSSRLISELRHTNTGYMFASAPQPFVMDMVRVSLDQRMK